MVSRGGGGGGCWKYNVCPERCLEICPPGVNACPGGLADITYACPGGGGEKLV